MTALRDSADPTGKSPSRLVVFDFDDTLYDWIGHFVPVLEAMVRAAAPLLGVSTTALRLEMQAVHTRYGNTEQPFALLETESTERLLGDHTREEQRQVLSPAFEAFDRVRARKLRLYDDVIPTFNRLREERVPLAGYSTAPSVNLAKRIKRPASPTSSPGSMPHRSPGRTRKRAGLTVSNHRDAKAQARSRRRRAHSARDFDVAPRDTLFVGDSIASRTSHPRSSAARERSSFSALRPQAETGCLTCFRCLIDARSYVQTQPISATQRSAVCREYPA